MKGWLIVNLFFLALIGIGAGSFWLFGTLVQWIHPRAVILAAVAALVFTGWLTPHLLGLLERWGNRAH